MVPVSSNTLKMEVKTIYGAIAIIKESSILTPINEKSFSAKKIESRMIVNHVIAFIRLYPVS
jgi:hypothetical protein